MTREQLEHVIRASAAITNERFVEVGRQAVLHDLAVSKCVAGREKDLRFIAVMLKESMILFSTPEQLIRQLDPAHSVESIVAWARRR